MTIYLDHNATTPLDPRVLEAMLPWLGARCANPSSVHGAGRAARHAIDQAREQVAALVGAQAAQIVFTSGGTEANNLAVKGVATVAGGGRVAVSRIEHPSVLEPAQWLGSQGWTLEFLDPDEQGRVPLEAVRGALRRHTRLVSLMWANNETGVVQDVPAAALARDAGALCHSDAVQAAGKIPVDFQASGLHLMSLSAHKLYGPAGVGALVVERAVELAPLLHGGGQERGLRPGTENVAGIVGFGQAAELARQELDERGRRLRDLRQRLERGLAQLEGVRIVAAGAERLPNTTQIMVPGIEGETLLMNLDRDGIEVSSGSACASGKQSASHVLLAMGIDPELARCVIRVSLGAASTEEHVRRLLQALSAQSAMVRKLAARAAGP